MSVRIRLRRMGTRKKAFYRIVVADQRTSRDGRFIELLGTYDPRADPPEIKLDTEKAQGWLAKGAQPSDVVRSILVRQGILERPAITYTPKAKAVPVEAPAAETPAPEAAAAEVAASEVAAPEAEAPEAEAPEAAAAESAQPEEPAAAPETPASEEPGA